MKIVSKWTGTVESFMSWKLASMFNEANLASKDFIGIDIADGQLVIKRKMSKTDAATRILEIANVVDGEYSMPKYLISLSHDLTHYLCAVSGNGIIGIGYACIDSSRSEDNEKVARALAWCRAFIDFKMTIGSAYVLPNEFEELYNLLQS